MEWKKFCSMEYGKIVFHSIPFHSMPYTRDNQYEPFTASDSMNSLIGMIFSSISKAPVGVLRNAEEIIRHASLCAFESFFARYFLFTPPTSMYTHM